MHKKRIVVLLSGSGSNLQALIDSLKSQCLNGSIVAVLSNNAEAFGLTRARNAGIDSILVEHQNFDSRESFEQAMINKISAYQPDLIILAGFMRILTPEFVKTYSGKLLNIHPSLLPKYPGLNTHRRALQNQDDLHGTSVHFVTEELDGGPVVAQATMPLDLNKNEKEVAAKIQELEHKLYPLVTSWFLNDRLIMQKDGVYFDKNKLDEPIKLAHTQL